MKKPTKAEKFTALAKAYVSSLRFPARRALLTVEAADSQGRLNGMTIVELIAIVNLTAGTGEKVYITVKDKTITLWAEKVSPTVPTELW